MKENGKGSIVTIIISITIILIIILLIGCAFYFFNQFKQANDHSVESINQAQESNYIPVEESMTKNTNNIETMNGSVKYSSANQQIKCYSIKLFKQKGREKEYQLDRDFSANFKMSADDDNSLEIVLNKSGYTIKDGMYFSDYSGDEENAFTINFYRIGDYLTFTSHNATDIRSIHLYVIDKQGKLYKDIYDLDANNSGMLADSVEFKGESIIINATRISHGPTIVYNGNPIYEPDELKAIPSNTPLSATYTYTMDKNGNIDFNAPSVKVKVTMSDFLKSQSAYKTSN